MRRRSARGGVSMFIDDPGALRGGWRDDALYASLHSLDRIEVEWILATRHAAAEPLWQLRFTEEWLRRDPPFRLLVPDATSVLPSRWGLRFRPAGASPRSTAAGVLARRSRSDRRPRPCGSRRARCGKCARPIRPEPARDRISRGGHRICFDLRRSTPASA